MLCFLFVIALVLPAYAQDAKSPDIDSSLVCRDPEVIKAGDNYYKCLDVQVKNSRYNRNTSCDNPLPATLFKYLDIANKTCYLDRVNRERDAQEFYKLKLFSLKSGKYKDFINNNGVECINSERVKENITNCIRSQIGNVKGADDRYYILWKQSDVIYDKKSCLQAQAIKRCTLNVMRSEGFYMCPYEEDNMLYVGSLFDYMLERCTRIVPGWDDVSNSSPALRTSVVFWSIVILILPLHWDFMKRY